MTRTKILYLAIFLAGLIAIAWVGAGYVGTNGLALAVIALIGVFYLAGAFELKRFHEATAALDRALADTRTPPLGLEAWLAGIPAALRQAVRLRLEGARMALPGPAMTPYLAGLLVLLGMLGTFLGMVATLRGTGAALESATDLQAIRASLAAPVRGLGFAFGTSVAGVAASAALGLLSAFLRRERLLASQALDAQVATNLRGHTLAQQREESFKLMQRQAELLPELVDKMQAMMAAMARQSEALGERLAAGQEAFHAQAQSRYGELASSVGQSLQASLAESARIAGAAIQPAVEATMASMARETAALRETVGQAVQRQLDELTRNFEAGAAMAAATWNDALATHQRASSALSDDMRGVFERFATTFEQRSASLVEQVASRVEAAAGQASLAWGEALVRHEQASGKLAQDARESLGASAEALERHASELADKLAQSQSELRAELAARDEQRLDAWSGTLERIAGTLRQEWEEAGARAAGQQQEICQTLARTASELAAQTQAESRETIAEVGRLAQRASEASGAAAEVILELRQKLSDSMARDNTMLEERGRLLETLGSLLDTVTQASTRQRESVDALVSASADMLERVGSRFTEQVGDGAGKVESAAAQLAAGSAEVARLGESLGQAVAAFGQSNDKLLEQLQRIEGQLDKSMARSDEQLAYYVAQAREVVELSVLSQKQIIEELRQAESRRAPEGEAE